MEWTEFVLQLIERIGLPGILGAVTGSVVTLLVKAKIDRDAETRRRLNERRCEVLESVYAALYDMHVALEYFATPDCGAKEQEERSTTFRIAANSFRAKWQHGRFWFDAAVGKLLDEIWKLYKDAGYALDDARGGQDFAKNRQQARQLLNARIPNARDAIEREIRNIVGVAS